MKNKIVFFGSSVFGLPSLNELLAMADVELVAIVSQSSKPVGRKGQLTPTPVAIWAAQHNIPLLTPTSLRTAEAVISLKDLKADTFIVAAYGLILPQNVLDIPKHGCINLHASLLPKYRGASPIAAAILGGEPETGISFMVMDAGIDTGPVLRQFPLDIQPHETTPELEARLAKIASSRLPDVFREWCTGTIKVKPQSGPSSYAPMLTSKDGQATWESAAVLERKIRAYQPWPGVWTTWNGNRLKILSAEVRTEHQSEPIGTIVATPDAPGWAIVCQDGLLIPHQVHMAGKQPVQAVTLPINYPGFIGTILT